MTSEPIWITKDGQAMARCPDCNRVQKIDPEQENIIEVGAKGQPTGVICQECWQRTERAGGRLA